MNIFSNVVRYPSGNDIAIISYNDIIIFMEEK